MYWLHPTVAANTVSPLLCIVDSELPVLFPLLSSMTILSQVNASCTSGALSCALLMHICLMEWKHVFKGKTQEATFWVCGALLLCDFSNEGDNFFYTSIKNKLQICLFWEMTCLQRPMKSAKLTAWKIWKKHVLSMLLILVIYPKKTPIRYCIQCIHKSWKKKQPLQIIWNVQCNQQHLLKCSCS